MKKCPYCAEEIQDEAIVCRYCGRDLVEKLLEPMKLIKTVDPFETVESVVNPEFPSQTEILTYVSKSGFKITSQTPETVQLVRSKKFSPFLLGLAFVNFFISYLVAIGLLVLAVIIYLISSDQIILLQTSEGKTKVTLPDGKKKTVKYIIDHKGNKKINEFLY